MFGRLEVGTAIESELGDGIATNSARTHIRCAKDCRRLRMGALTRKNGSRAADAEVGDPASLKNCVALRFMEPHFDALDSNGQLVPD